MLVRIWAVLLTSLFLVACGGGDDVVDQMDNSAGSTAISSSSDRVTLGVNSYLWHATLDTLSFMPLQSADPFGGVVITDWYSNPSTPTDRMRVTVYILDRRLRADGLKVAVFRQTKSDAGWADAAVNPETANKLEDAILTRARELRLASGGGS
ncbi:MAG TPA: DUF3576 domain-containing protein [Rhizomicrobium sp.]|nr:DUF3576 domain-containing protein [Rhizomicrobium sp.]